MEQTELLSTVREIICEYGKVEFLTQGQVGVNTEHRATYETLITVVSDSDTTFPEADFRAKLAAQIAEYRAVGFKRTYNEQTREFVLQLDPIFTYRDPSVLDANGKTLYSISVGFPFVSTN